MLFLPAIAWVLDLLAFLAPKKKKHKPKPVQLLQYETDEIVRDVLEGPFDDEVYKKIKETFWDELERYGVISKGMESFRQVFIGELGDGIIPYLDRFEEDLSKIRFRHEPDDSAKSLIEKVKLFFLNTKYRTINRFSGYYFEGIKPFVAELFSMRIRPIYIQVFGIIWFFSKDDDKSKLIVLMLFFFPLIVTILEDIFDLNERKTS